MTMEFDEVGKVLNNLEGTIEFKLDSISLFSNIRGSLTILDAVSEDGESAIRLIRTPEEELVFQHLSIKIGLRECNVNLEGFEEFDEFKVFLVWSPEEIRLHIGPTDRKKSTDLRTVSTSEVISDVEKNEAGHLVALESDIEVGTPEISGFGTDLSLELEKITKTLENSASQTFSEDLEAVLRTLHENNATPNGKGMTKEDIEEELENKEINIDINVSTLLEKLNDVGLVNRYSPPGPEFYVVSESRDEIINGEVDEAVDEEINALINHIQSDNKVRDVVADVFQINPTEVEDFLSSTTADKIDQLNKAVSGIEDSDEVEKNPDYGKIRFLNSPYRYELTPKSVSFLK